MVTFPQQPWVKKGKKNHEIAIFSLFLGPSRILSIRILQWREAGLKAKFMSKFQNSK